MAAFMVEEKQTHTSTHVDLHNLENNELLVVANVTLSENYNFIL